MTIITLHTSHPSIEEHAVEFVERKGIGHPDSLCDGIAEEISTSYSDYCLKRFGVVPNHWVDKCMLVGGECQHDFGSGEMIHPMTIFVVGKITHQIGSEIIPVEEISKKAIHKYLSAIFELIDIENDVQIHLHTNSAVGAGRHKTWYRPDSLDDLLKLSQRTANDAVICTGYAPLSKTEQLVLDLEKFLNGKEFKKSHPEIGTDIKIIAHRHGQKLTLTLCIPFIAKRTPSRSYYENKKNILKDLICEFVYQNTAFKNIEVHINTRDNQDTVYMTHLGSAADTGDVGVVGRGNRLNGLISPCREMSIEAPCGKNPIYHTGKLYSVLAQTIADRIYKETQVKNYVNITSETGVDLTKPHFVAVKAVGNKELTEETARRIVEEECQNIESIQNRILRKELQLF